MRTGAGSIILSKSTKRILLTKRSVHLRQAGKWSSWGGWINSGEDPLEGALRELVEETGFSGQILEKHSLLVYQKYNFQYHNFLLVVEDEFEPITDWETDEFAWFELDKFPDALHFGLKSLMDEDSHKIRQLIEAL
jgi:8-oxo-dGTP pyrophosphatase MutT (NUDIX family)